MREGGSLRRADDQIIDAHGGGEIENGRGRIFAHGINRQDAHAAFFTTLAVVASSVERLATEIRHLQRTEVLEAEEYFSEGQKGSSAMPHKRNPVLTENLTGLARLVRQPPGGDRRSLHPLGRAPRSSGNLVTSSPLPCTQGERGRGWGV